MSQIIRTDTSILWGATEDEWNALKTLTPTDVLPTLLDPNTEMSPRSRVRGGMKTPSRFNSQGLGVGISAWASYEATTGELNRWSEDPRVGAGLVCRTIHVIDIDISDSVKAAEVEALVATRLDAFLPRRTRSNSGKRALFFRLIDPQELIKKKVISTESGKIEWLFHRQFVVMAGRHDSGVRYEWPEGIPSSLEQVPAITYDQLKDLYNFIATSLLAETPPDPWGAHHIVEVGPRYRDQIREDDPVVRWLDVEGWIRQWNSDGSISVRSPWEDEYSTTSGPTTVVYYPAGVGGRETHGFSSMHATDVEKGRATDVGLFLDAAGYTADIINETFPVLDPEVDEDGEVIPPRPFLEKTNNNGVARGTLLNIVVLLQWLDKKFRWSLAYDKFKDQMLIREGEKSDAWRPFVDEDYTRTRLRITRTGVDSDMPKQTVIDAVHLNAQENQMDTAISWLEGLTWDGQERIEYFAKEVLGLECEYSTSVWLYFFTAAAGRVLRPGTKADMTPVLIGDQGIRKSTLVEVLAPVPEAFTPINLSERDADLARLLRGILVAEWEELRGINTREEEAIKGWLTRSKDEWIPKFKEFAIEHPRRFMIVGTTNQQRFLNDPTGSRRFLPLRVEQMINTEWVIENRDQLWAQGAVLFKEFGVLWQDAERLADQARRESTVRDPWVSVVTRWLEANGWEDGFDTDLILEAMIGIDSRQADFRHLHRVRRTMAFIGFTEDLDGKWHFTLA